MTPARFFSNLLAAALFAVANASAATGEDLISKTFPVNPGGQLIIEADRGSIETKPTTANEVRIEVFRKLNNFGNLEEVLAKHEVTIEQDNDTVRVRAETKGAKLFWQPISHLQVRYVVSIPKKFNVNLRTSGGAINVADLDGEATARTSGGAIRLGRISGKVQARTSGGSIQVAEARNDCDVQTSGGSISVGTSHKDLVARTSGGSIKVEKAAGNVIAHTSGGSITLQDTQGTVEAETSGGSIRAALGKQPSGNCRFKTSGGRIDLGLAANLAVDLEAGTSGGRVVADIPVSNASVQKKNAFKGQLNGGGPLVQVHTSGGSIQLRKI